jgi:hypothetical protein
MINIGLSSCCRNLSNDQLEKVVKVKSLSDFPKGVIFEIHAIEEVQSGSEDGGVFGVADYEVTMPDKSRDSGRVRLSENVMKNAWLVPPCLLYYQGTKTGKNNRTFYDVSAVKCTTGQENLKKVADGFRSMSKSSMVACLTTQSLECFRPYTVFMFSGVKKRKLKKDREECLTVKYETQVDEEFLQGGLVVPARYEEKLKNEGCGAMVYRGMKTSGNGRSYHDLVIYGADSKVV